jgi:hypothetical protein
VRCGLKAAEAPFDPVARKKFERNSLEIAVANRVVVRKKPEVRPRAGIGLASLLAQSDAVVQAFGPERGFKLMVLAVLAGTGVSASTVFFILKGISRVLGF